MNKRHPLVQWLNVAAIALLLSAAPAQAQVIDDAYQAGLDAASEYRYAEALLHFQVAAERGNRKAQRASGLMLLYGERLYGAEVQADPVRARMWLQKAAEQGCDTATALLHHAHTTPRI